MLRLFDIPQEVIDAQFSDLTVKDLLALRLTSLEMKRFSRDVQSWSARTDDVFGVVTHSTEGYLIHTILHLFHRGLNYAHFLSTQNSDNCKKTVERCEQFFKKAYELTEQFSTETHPDKALICYLRGYMLYAGLGVERDCDKGLAYLSQAAALGNVDAMLLLGLMHLQFPNMALWLPGGYGSDDYDPRLPSYRNCDRLRLATSNPEQGLDWVVRAQNAGSDEAACVRATLAGTREGNDSKIAILTRAADKGGRHSPYILGRLMISMFKEYFIYRRQAEFAGHADIGLRYITLAAERNNAEAEYRLARLYLGSHLADKGNYVQPRFNDNIVVADPEKGLQHLKLASVRHGAAAYLLGRFLCEGKKIEIRLVVPVARVARVARDLDAAIDCFKRGYYNNLSAECAMELGFIFLTKRYSKNRALFWFENAGNLGNMEALQILARLHLYGNRNLGLEVNDAIADRFLAKLMLHEDQCRFIPNIIVDGARLSSKYDGVEREINLFQFLKWQCRVAAVEGFVGLEMDLVLKKMPPEIFAGKKEIADAISVLASMIGTINLPRDEIIQKLITIAPVVIKPKFLNDHLAFLNKELVASKQDKPMKL